MGCKSGSFWALILVITVMLAVLPGVFAAELSQTSPENSILTPISQENIVLPRTYYTFEHGIFKTRNLKENLGCTNIEKINKMSADITNKELIEASLSGNNAGGNCIFGEVFFNFPRNALISYKEGAIKIKQKGTVGEKKTCELGICQIGNAVKKLITEALTALGIVQGPSPSGCGDGFCRNRDGGNVGLCDLSDNCYKTDLDYDQDLYDAKNLLTGKDIALLSECIHVDRFGNGFENVPCEQQIEFFDNANKLIKENKSFLRLSDEFPVYKYTVNFSNSSSPVEVKNRHSTLKFLGEEWRVIHPEGENIKKIILMSQNKRESVSSEGSIVNYNGRNYEISVSSGKKEIIINGETFQFNVGDIVTLSDGTEIGIPEFLDGIADVSFGTRKISLEDGKEVRVWSALVEGDKSINGSLVEIESYDIKKENRIKRISISYSPASAVNIGAKASWTDPIFGKFKFVFDGIVPAENCSSCENDCGKCPVAEPFNDTGIILPGNETSPIDLPNETNAAIPENDTIPSENQTIPESSIKLPDVAATMLSEQLAVDSENVIHAELENIGEGNASEVSVIFYEVNGQGEVPLMKKTIGDLICDEKKQVDFVFIANETKTYHFKIMADAVLDSNLSNNYDDQFLTAVSASSEPSINNTSDDSASNDSGMIVLPTTPALPSNSGSESSGGSGGSGGGSGGSSRGSPETSYSEPATYESNQTATSNDQLPAALPSGCNGPNAPEACKNGIRWQWPSMKLSAFMNLWWVILIILILVLIFLITSYREIMKDRRNVESKKAEFFSSLQEKQSE